MTVASIEAAARRLLQDKNTPYRWDGAEIRDALQEGIGALNAIRPETRYVNGELVDYVALPEEDDAVIDISDRFAEALTYYVAYRCYLDDSSDTVNQQLADSYLSKFNTKAQL